MEISISSRCLAAAVKLASKTRADSSYFNRYIGILPTFQEKGAVVVACNSVIAFVGYDPNGHCVLPTSYAPNKSIASAFSKGRKDSVVKITEDATIFPKASYPILNGELYPGAPTYAPHIQKLFTKYTIPPYGSYESDPSIFGNFCTETMRTLFDSIKAFGGLDFLCMQCLEGEARKDGFPPTSIVRSAENTSVMWIVAPVKVREGEDEAELQKDFTTTTQVFDKTFSHFTKTEVTENE